MKSLSLLKRLAPVCVVALLAAFAAGYMTTRDTSPDMVQRPEEKEAAEENRVQPNNNAVMEYAPDIKTSPNARLILKTYHLRCGHTTVERQNIEGTLVDLDQEGLLGHYPGWEIEKFQSDEVILHRRVEGACPGHFLLKAENGYIAIFSIVEDGKEEISEVTDIPISILRLKDQQRLREGILLDSIEEVNQYLEDLGS